ncbi:MAG: enoyl-CoA hydratase [Melioribacteraceae bacterium]|nr:MAG: enoyl-CoA hydratase [Melioribacteraceae bacterium]
MENGFVKSKTSNNFGLITFGHPKSNSLPSEVLAKLAAEIRALGENDKVRVIGIQSAGEKTFCAGASFDELLSINNFETGKQFFSGFANVINAIRKAPKFVVTRVQGKAVGGGVGLICASDYAFGTTEAAVKLSELALGIGPFVVGPAVERKVGKAAFNEMAIDYDWRDAIWAFNKGMFSDIFDTIDELDAAFADIIVKLANSSPEAMKELKRVLWEGTSDWDELLEKRAEISGKLVLSDFTKDYINQFMTE